MAGDPTDMHRLLGEIAMSATQVCAAQRTAIHLLIGNRLYLHAIASTAQWQAGEELQAYGEAVMRQTRGRVVQRHWAAGCAVLDRTTMHVVDALRAAEYPITRAVAMEGGYRTLLVVPLLQGGEPKGVIASTRDVVHPFSKRQITLLQTFADQAVIAKENARLFGELQVQLEQQTATSDILRVIASSPTDLQGMLEAIGQTALRLCAADDAVLFREDGADWLMAAHVGPIPAQVGTRVPIRAVRQPEHPTRSSATGVAYVEGRVVHLGDVQGLLHVTGHR